VIVVTELLYSVQLIYSVNFKTIPLLITASIWYLICTTVLYVGQYYLERYYGRGTARDLPLTPLERVRMGILSIRRPSP
jgi:polar amino acid transport system permease protein